MDIMSMAIGLIIIMVVVGVYHYVVLVVNDAWQGLTCDELRIWLNENTNARALDYYYSFCNISNT